MRRSNTICFLLIVISFTGCSLFDPTKKELKELMSSVTAIEIKCYGSKDSASQILTEKKQLDIFREIITGKNENILPGSITGRILYFRDKTEILRVDNTTSGIEYHYKSNTYKSKITYRAGRFMEDACHNLLNPPPHQ